MNQKIVSFFSKKSHQYAAMGLLVLGLFILIYSLIPLPTINDGYLSSETRKVSYESPFTLNFSQPMNRESVQAHFSIEPSIEGKMNWLDSHTLQFIPYDSLKIGDEYQIMIGSKAKSIYQKSINVDLNLKFVVSGAPYVKFISPYLPAEEVEGELDEEGVDSSELSLSEPLVISENQKITVMFDRPMRPLGNISADSQDDFPQLEISPPVKGKYKWIGTTAFQFVPEKWPLGTTYDITLPKGISSLDGGKTENEISWTLLTEELKVVNTVPSKGDDAVSPNEQIKVTFNQPVNLDDIQPGNNIVLFPSNDLDASQQKRKDGFFNTLVTYGQDDKGAKDDRTLVFKPEFPYQHEQKYEFKVLPGLNTLASAQESGYGDRFMSESFSLDFKVVKKPDIISWSPNNGDQSYDQEHISIRFASPVSEEVIRDSIELVPPSETLPKIDLFESYSDEGTVWDAEIYYDLRPSSSYEFAFNGPFKDKFDNISDKGFKVNFKTAPRAAYLNLFKSGNFGLFTTGIDPFYTIKTTNINEVKVRACAVSEEEFLRVSRQYTWYDYHCSSSFQKIVPIEAQLNESQITELNLAQIFGKSFDPGSYFFEVSSDDYLDYDDNPRVFYQTFFVSDTHLALKKSDNDLLVWATDLKTGQPLSNLSLKIMSESGALIKKGVTNEKGVYRLEGNFGQDLYVISGSENQTKTHWSMVNEFWNQGIQSWQFNGISGEWINDNEPRVYLYTDRPLYKPLDTIHFKGLYRIDRDAGLYLPKDPKVKLVLEDSEYNQIEEQEVSVLTDGSFNGSFKLTEKARLGRYNIYAELVNSSSSPRFYHHFFVEEYKKPKFKVDLLSEKSDYQFGDLVSVKVNASYFFGGAITDGKLDWSVSRDAYYFDQYKGGRYFSFSKWGGFHCFWYDCRGSTDYTAQGSSELNEKGEIVLEIPYKDDDFDQSYLYNLEVTVENKDGQQVTGHQSFVVHKDSYYPGLSTDQYIIGDNSEIEFQLIAVDLKGELIDSQSVDLELFYEQWNSVKKKGVDGEFYEENVQELKLIYSDSVTTDRDNPDISIPVSKDWPGGRYILRANTSKGLASEISFYRSSGDYINWGSTNNDRIELIADQAEYYVGGKAKVLIKSPYSVESNAIKALVTYERSNIKHYEVIDIKTSSHTLEVPIDETMVPNFYVSVMLVKGPGEKLDQFIANQNSVKNAQQIELIKSSIVDLKKELSLIDEKKEPDNRDLILQSRSEVRLKQLNEELSNIKSSDENLSAIDFSLVKPDFKMGTANLRVNHREKKVYIDLETNKESYKIGEPVEISIYTKDYQNRPVSSVLSLAVVDQSLLALKANTKEDPIDYFYANRALQVGTASNLTIHADRVDVDSAKGAKGGGGDANESTFDKKRGEFKDTAYYNPVIKTDKGGYAKVTFDPPDNLTTWQIWGVASSAEDRFGMTKKDFVVQKPISISGILPRFMISGDQIQIGALVHNMSGERLTTKVALSSSDLMIDGSNKKSVVIENGESERVNWQVSMKAIQKNKDITISFESKQDSVEYKIPAYTFAYPEVVATNGVISDFIEEKIRLPKALISEMGSLSLAIGGSPLTSFMDSFEGLKEYPYGCVEQLTSKILPSLSVLAASKNKTADWFSWLNLDRKKTESYVQGVLADIDRFQRFDGGYGYWEGSNSSYALLTSYVLYAQKIALDLGLTVDENSVNQAIQYLWNQVNQVDSDLTLNDKAFALWVLSEQGQNDTGITLSLFEKRDQLSIYAKAFMLMNLNNLLDGGQAAVRTFITRLKSEIVADQIIRDREISFEEKGRSYFDLNTNRRTTAIVLMALNRDNPNNPILDNIVNYLSKSQKHQNLLNTQETSWILMSVLEYANGRNLLSSDMLVGALLNQKQILEGEVDANNLSAVYSEDLSLTELNDADSINTIRFEVEGEGQANYNMELKYYLPNESIEPLEKGFYISRKYFAYEGEDNEGVNLLKSGELYKGEISLIVPEDRHQVVVEERLPAGLEAINFNLDNVQKSIESQLNQSEYWYDNPLWHFNHTEVRSDRVLLFADYLPKGVYTYEFLVRAGLPGKYHHLPASAYQMYFPEVFGRTEGKWIEVKK